MPTLEEHERSLRVDDTPATSKCQQLAELKAACIRGRAP